MACELLSDVHELCARRDDYGELIGLRKYLAQDRGWRCLAVLHLLGVRGLSCGRELVALLVALYPVALQDVATAGSSAPRNHYVRFHCNDDTVDTVDIVPHIARRVKSNGLFYDAGRRRRSSRKHVVGAKQQRSLIPEARRRNTPDATSSESEPVTDDQARSLTLKIRLNPMDFEYFTSVVRSGDEEQRWQAELYELPPRPVRKTPRDYVDERIRDVLDARISNFEISLLIIQLLQGLRDYDTPAEQTPAVQVLKFALDTLWSLQFGIDGVYNNLSGTECATLKAAAARLMLTALERALRADEPTTAVIHNGLLPMTLRLLEDACGKPASGVLEPEEGSLLQEFIFATVYGIIAFLYCLLHQRSGNVDKLSDFLELFQLFVESQEGKLVERTVFKIVDLPSVDSAKSFVRARKIIDMIGALTSGLKRIRRDLSHATQCHRTKHKSCVDYVQSHHHSDLLGTSYPPSVVGAVNKQVCCISSLFATLVSLLKQSHLFVSELQVRLIKVITAAGTCCCFPPRILVSSVVAFLKKRDSSTYAPAVAFLERTLFKELAAYPLTCGTCDRPADWGFLEMYVDLLSPSDPKLCYVVMAHLLKVTPSSRYHVREQLLLKVFYSTFLRAKACYSADNGNATAKFLLQSCISIVSCLIVNAQMCERFMELGGLREVLTLMPDTAFTRSVYALLEVTVTIEIWRGHCEEATRSLLESLDEETNELLESLQRIEKTEEKQRGEKRLADSTDQIDTERATSVESRRIPVEEGETNLYRTSAAWRAAAGVALCSPKFRIELSAHPVSRKLLRLFKLLAVGIVTDSIEGNYRRLVGIGGRTVLTYQRVSSFF